MVAENSRQRWRGKPGWVLLAVTLLVPAARAQQASSATQTTSQAQSDDKTISASPDTSANPGDLSTPPVPALVVNEIAPVRSIGAARLLDSASSLRWGNFSIGTLSYLQAYQNLSEAGKVGSTTNNVSMFSTQLIYEKAFRRFHLALQYQPRIMIFDGQFVNDLLNQNLQLDTAIALSPRWTLSLGDIVVYRQSRDMLGESLLDVDTATGTTLQTNFLQGSGSYLDETVNSSFNYLWSPHTKIAFGPSFTFTRVSGVGLAGGESSSRAYAFRTIVTHDLTSRTSIGAYEHVEMLTAANAAFGDTLYNDFGASITQLIGDTWHIGGSFGAATAGFGTGRQWTESIAANVTKTFHESDASLAYFRGQVLAGYVTNHFGERIDLLYRTHLGSRLRVGAGGGYERDITGDNGIWGKYGNGQMNYQLTRSVSWVVDYVRKWQRGDDVQLFNGTENLVTFGISWDPRAGMR